MSEYAKCQDPTSARIDYLIFIYDPVLYHAGARMLLYLRASGRRSSSMVRKKYHVPSPLCFVENKNGTLIDVTY